MNLAPCKCGRWGKCSTCCCVGHDHDNPQKQVCGLCDHP